MVRLGVHIEQEGRDEGKGGRKYRTLASRLKGRKDLKEGRAGQIAIIPKQNGGKCMGKPTKTPIYAYTHETAAPHITLFVIKIVH